jgi:hypothetical protein
VIFWWAEPSGLGQPKSSGKGIWFNTPTVTIALSNEEMTKIKIVDLKKLYKFVVENFFI